MTRVPAPGTGVQRVLGGAWALPRLDAHNRAFFTAGVLTLQQCSACRHVQHPPDDVCATCGGFELGWFASAGDGRIASLPVVTQAVHPALPPPLPYAIVLVSLDPPPGILAAGPFDKPEGEPARREGAEAG